MTSRRQALGVRHRSVVSATRISRRRSGAKVGAVTCGDEDAGDLSSGHDEQERRKMGGRDVSGRESAVVDQRHASASRRIHSDKRPRYVPNPPPTALLKRVVASSLGSGWGCSSTAEASRGFLNTPPGTRLGWCLWRPNFLLLLSRKSLIASTSDPTRSRPNCSQDVSLTDSSRPTARAPHTRLADSSAGRERARQGEGSRSRKVEGWLSPLAQMAQRCEESDGLHQREPVNAERYRNGAGRITLRARLAMMRNTEKEEDKLVQPDMNQLKGWR